MDKEMESSVLGKAAGDVPVSVLLAKIRGRYREVVAFVCTMLAISTLYLVIATPKYTVTMILGPSEDILPPANSTNSITALAMMRGASTNPQARFDILTSLFHSTVVADRMARNPEILRTVFDDEWDPDTKSWHPSHSVTAVPGMLLDMIFGRPGWHPPSGYRLEQYIEKRVQIEPFGDASTVSKIAGLDPDLKEVTFEFKDPRFGVLFLRALYDTADSEMRQAALTRSTTYIAYLEKKLATVQLGEHRQALTDLLIDQERSLMLTQSKLPYAARLLSPPTASTYPTNPNVLLVLLASVLIGIFLGVLWIVSMEHSFIAVLRALAERIATRWRSLAARLGSKAGAGRRT